MAVARRVAAHTDIGISERSSVHPRIRQGWSSHSILAESACLLGGLLQPYRGQVGGLQCLARIASCPLVCRSHLAAQTSDIKPRTKSRKPTPRSSIFCSIELTLARPVKHQKLLCCFIASRIPCLADRNPGSSPSSRIASSISFSAVS